MSAMPTAEQVERAAERQRLNPPPPLNDEQIAVLRSATRSLKRR